MLIQNLLIILLEMDQVEHDPDFIALSRQFKTTAMELISVLEQVLFELDFTIWLFCSKKGMSYYLKLVIYFIDSPQLH